MTKIIYVHSCGECPHDVRCAFSLKVKKGISEKCTLPDAPPDALRAEKKEVAISCAAGPPCCYLTFGNFYGCNFNGDCEFQRPRIPKG